MGLKATHWGYTTPNSLVLSTPCPNSAGRGTFEGRAARRASPAWPRGLKKKKKQVEILLVRVGEEKGGFGLRVGLWLGLGCCWGFRFGVGLGVWGFGFGGWFGGLGWLCLVLSLHGKPSPPALYAWRIRNSKAPTPSVHQTDAPNILTRAQISVAFCSAEKVDFLVV